MSVKERLKLFAKSEGIRVSTIEKTMGASNGYVNSISKNIGIDKLNLLVEYYSNINLEWLLTGKGNMLKTDDSYVSEPAPNYFNSGNRNHNIPLYNGVVLGGEGDKSNQNERSDIIDYIDIGGLFKGAIAALEVYGDSMLPLYKSGSIVALKPVNDKSLIMFGQDYVIETSEYRVIKRLVKSASIENWTCISLNMETYEGTDVRIHEPFDVSVDSVIRLYKVLGCISKS